MILIIVILLQPGKADAGALFSNTLSSTAFGPRGTASLLAKITIGAAVAFMLIALALGFAVGKRSSSDTNSGSCPDATSFTSRTSRTSRITGCEQVVRAL